MRPRALAGVLRRSGLLTISAGALIAGLAPANAQCNSGATDSGERLDSSFCQASASIGGTAIGLSASAFLGATALGSLTNALGVRATSLGASAGSSAAVEGALSVGFNSLANGAYATAIGAGDDNVTHPQRVTANGAYSIAIGGSPGGGSTAAASAVSNFSIAIGTSSVAQGDESVSVGFSSGDHGGPGSNRNSAFGGEAGRFVTGGGNTGLGLAAGSTVKGSLNAALGNSAGQFVTGSNNIAGGVLAGRFVKGAYNLALGSSAGGSVTGHSNVAIGLEAGDAISASDTIAVGTKSRALASSAIAIGTKAVAKFSQSVAIGTNSVTSAANVISVGAPGQFRRIMNVANAAAANDAVNLGQVKALIKAASPPAVVATIAPVASASRMASAAGRLLSHSGRQGTTSAAATRAHVSTQVASIGASRTSTAAVQSAATAAASEEDLESSTIVGWANVSPDGAVSGSRNITGHARHSAGSYEIVFKKIASNRCTYNATLAGIGLVSVTTGSLANSLKVETRSHNGVLTDTGFYLMAVC
jgi:hypothetical protein